MTPKDFQVKAIEILKVAGVTPVRHFSPYDESRRYESGSGVQIFWDAAGKQYRFLFDGNGECVYNCLLLNSAEKESLKIKES